MEGGPAPSSEAAILDKVVNMKEQTDNTSLQYIDAVTRLIFRKYN
jgi:hypothetical protein